MIIKLQKFGTTLISRQAGREALLAFRPTLRDIKPGEKIDIDFEGILTLSPSWADEFFTPLMDEFGDRLAMLSTDNPSVKATLDILEETSGKKFLRI